MGFIEREIEGLTRFLGKVLFNKDVQPGDLIDDEGMLSGQDFFRHTLFQMIEQGKIGEAEDMLFDALETGPAASHFGAAIAFYDRLSKLDEGFLADCNFSREEIAEGLAAVEKLVAAGE